MGITSERRSSTGRSTEPSGPLEIHIEELVLHGFPNVNRKQFQSVVEGELARLFDQQQPSVEWEKVGEISHVDAGRFEVSVDQGIESAGLGVARAVYSSLTGGQW